MSERAATLHLDSWAGRTRHPVTVIGETPKRYRVRLEDAVFQWPKGKVKLVPKYAITFKEGKV